MKAPVIPVAMTSVRIVQAGTITASLIEPMRQVSASVCTIRQPQRLGRDYLVLRDRRRNAGEVGIGLDEAVDPAAARPAARSAVGGSVQKGLQASILTSLMKARRFRNGLHDPQAGEMRRQICHRHHDHPGKYGIKQESHHRLTTGTQGKIRRMAEGAEGHDDGRYRNKTGSQFPDLLRGIVNTRKNLLPRTSMPP